MSVILYIIVIFVSIFPLDALMKTPAEVKQEFAERGLSISGWAKARGYSQALVYQGLNGSRKALRGESHNIAVELGLKEGKTGCYGDLSIYKAEVIQ